jgi:hypothetical protein
MKGQWGVSVVHAKKEQGLVMQRGVAQVDEYTKSNYGAQG